jgi:hypothetical protein
VEKYRIFEVKGQCRNGRNILQTWKSLILFFKLAGECRERHFKRTTSEKTIEIIWLCRNAHWIHHKEIKFPFYIERVHSSIVSLNWLYLDGFILIEISIFWSFLTQALHEGHRETHGTENLKKGLFVCFETKSHCWSLDWPWICYEAKAGCKLMILRFSASQMLGL